MIPKQYYHNVLQDIQSLKTAVDTVLTTQTAQDMNRQLQEDPFYTEGADWWGDLQVESMDSAVSLTEEVN